MKNIDSENKNLETLDTRGFEGDKAHNFTVKNAGKSARSVFLSGPDEGVLLEIGEIIADKLGYRLVNVNSVIEEELSMPAADMISLMGKTYFRVVEHSFLDKLSKEAGLVAVCGEGALLTKKNYYTVKRNGIIVYIAPYKGGASQSGAFLLQKPLYEKYCDKKTEHSGTAEKTAKAVLEALNDI